MLIPGVFSAYDPGQPNCNYCGGIFFYNPVTKTYRQDTTLFKNQPTPNPTPPPATLSPGKTSDWTGCVFGGQYDDVNDNVVVLGDSSGGGFRVLSWHMGTMTRNPDIPFTVTGPNGLRAAYFTGCRHVKLGRKVYVLGYWTDGTVASQMPLLFAWDLDAKTIQNLAPPPISGPTIQKVYYLRAAAAATKIVMPWTPNGPDGVVQGIYVYDPAANSWTVDNQKPATGYFAGNSIVELPNNRVGFAGSVFAGQQTNYWMYQPA
jgi:hypothetical protein